MRPATENGLAIYLWLQGRARSASRRLQPQQAHNLLYLALLHYAAENEGMLLAPVVFTAWQAGPREANLFGLFAEINLVDPLALPPSSQAVDFLNRFWQRVTKQSLADLESQIFAEPSFKASLSNGEGTLIDLEYMLEAAAFVAQETHIKKQVDERKQSPMWQALMKSVREAVPPAKSPNQPAHLAKMPAHEKLAPTTRPKSAINETQEMLTKMGISSYVKGPNGERYQRWLPPTRTNKEK